jgi:L-iditol 2-dehydrogenase
LFNNGAYAEFIRIPARIVEKNTYVVPDHLRYQDAALIEPLACVLRGLDESYVQPGDTVAVMGLGPIGLMFVRMAKAVCGARVVAIARRQQQIDTAIRLGADESVILDLDQPERTLARIRQVTGGRGADIVIEAVGQPAAWELATQSARKGGIVNFFGGCASGTRVGLDTQLLHYSEITCKASFHHTPDHIRRSLEIVASGRVNANHLVNREEPLDNLLQVMYDLMSRNGHIKTAIIP